MNGKMLWMAVWFVGLSRGIVPAEPGKPLLECLPADADLVLYVKDTTALVDQWQGTPFQKIAQDPVIAEWFKSPPATTEEGETKASLAWDKVGASLLKMFPGEAVLSVNHMPNMLVQPPPETRGDPEARRKARKAIQQKAMKEDRTVIVGRISANGAEFDKGLKDLLALTKHPDGKALEPPRKTKIGDVEVRLYEFAQKDTDSAERELAVAQVDDLGIIGFKLASVSETLSLIKHADRGATLASSRPFSKTCASHLVSFYIHLSTMFEHQKEMFGDTAAEFSAMMERMYDGLGMTALESLQGGLNIDDGFSILDVTLAYKQRKGILEMLAFQNDFVLRRSFIPKDAQTASISAFSIEETFAAVETTMDAIMPGMFKLAVMGQIGLYESTSKHSFQRDILGNLASEVVTVSASERPDDMVVLVKLNDQAAFKEAFGFLAGFLAGMRQQEGEAIDLHGLKARQFRLPASALNPNPNTMAYAYTRGYLVLSFGKHETLGKVVAGFKNPKDALWKQPLVQQAVRKLETDYVHLSYVSIPPVLASYLGQLAPFISRSVDDLPSLDHWETLIGDAVFSLHLEKNRFVGRAVLLPGSE